MSGFSFPIVLAPSPVDEEQRQAFLQLSFTKAKTVELDSVFRDIYLVEEDPSTMLRKGAEDDEKEPSVMDSVYVLLHCCASSDRLVCCCCRPPVNAGCGSCAVERAHVPVLLAAGAGAGPQREWLLCVAVGVYCYLWDQLPHSS